MKLRSFPLLAILFSLATLPLAAQSADDAYKRGMSAMNSGDVEIARKSFSEALRIDPNHAHARYQLGVLKQQEGQLVGKKRANQLAAVTLDKVDFSRVTLSEALQGLDQLIADQQSESKDPFTPNFMIQNGSSDLGEREVTIRLRGVPAKTALDYLLQQAGATARYDKHATVIRPAGES